MHVVQGEGQERPDGVEFDSLQVVQLGVLHPALHECVYRLPKIYPISLVTESMHEVLYLNFACRMSQMSFRTILILSALTRS